MQRSWSLEQSKRASDEKEGLHDGRGVRAAPHRWPGNG